MRWIHEEQDWKHVHRTGLRLVCPDQGCTQSLRACQNGHGTRYLSNLDDGSGCNHFIPAGGGGLMTDEHLWLQGVLRAMCRRLGFDAELEAGVDGARVDLRVAGKMDVFAFEVQRVSTDFSARRTVREQNGMRTLWFLPESDRQKNTATGKRRADPLFSEPCVRLGYRDAPGPRANAMTMGELREKVWIHPAKASVHLTAGVTVGRLAKNGLSFDSGWLPLEKFLQEVLEGDRRWYPQRAIHGKNGGTWAGWLLDEEVRRYRKHVAAAKEERRRQRNAEREEAGRSADCAPIQPETRRGTGAAVSESIETDAVPVSADGGEARDAHGDSPQADADAIEHNDVRTPHDEDEEPNAASARSGHGEPWWRRWLKLLVG